MILSFKLIMIMWLKNLKKKKKKKEGTLFLYVVACVFFGSIT